MILSVCPSVCPLNKSTATPRYFYCLLFKNQTTISFIKKIRKKKLFFCAKWLILFSVKTATAFPWIYIWLLKMFYAKLKIHFVPCVRESWDGETAARKGGWSSSSPPIRHSCTVILVLVLVLCIWVNYVGRIKRKTIWKSGIINRSHPASCILHPAPRSSALLQCIKWQVPESVRKIGKWKKKSEPSHESNRGRGGASR